MSYVSAPFSPFDLLSPSRWSRFKRAWLGRCDLAGVPIEKGLYEYVPRVSFPASGRILSFDSQLDLQRSFLPSWLLDREFDLCISDTSPSFVFAPSLNYRTRILRFNDKIDGFSPPLSPRLVEHYYAQLQGDDIDEIWAVSPPLLRDARKLRSDIPSILLPNGVDLDDFQAIKGKGQQRGVAPSALYLGSRGSWLDLDLICSIAKRLPNWSFSLIGPGFERGVLAPANVSTASAVNYEEVPGIMASHDVGLIPFLDCTFSMYCDSLKFYQYLAAGLAVVATDLPSLRETMGKWAHYGHGPKEFAGSLEEALEARCNRDAKDWAALDDFLATRAWSSILDLMAQRVEALLVQGKRS